MKEVPILYSTAMMRANLALNKTQTRRTRDLDEINQAPDEWKFCELELNPEIIDMHTGRAKQLNGLYATFMRVTGDHEEYRHIRCPYGQPGDLLWSRETVLVYRNSLDDDAEDKYLYRANGVDIGDLKWKPNMHMPKAAARHWSLNEEVNIQRLHDITEEDAKAEGIDYRYDEETGFEYKSYTEKLWLVNPVNSYATLWDSINGVGSWADNPWVWVIKYKTLSTTGKPDLSNISQ